MARKKGTLPFSGNFEPQSAAPFDARSRVEFLSDLTSESTWKALDGSIYIYPGMQTVVYNDPNAGNNGVYILKSTSFTSIDNWEKIGSGGTSGGIDDPFIPSNKSPINTAIFSAYETGSNDFIVELSYSIYNSKTDTKSAIRRFEPRSEPNLKDIFGFGTNFTDFIAGGKIRCEIWIENFDSSIANLSNLRLFISDNTGGYYNTDGVPPISKSISFLDENETYQFKTVLVYEQIFDKTLANFAENPVHFCLVNLGTEILDLEILCQNPKFLSYLTFESGYGDSSGLPDAPSDDKIYARSNASWVELPSSFRGTQAEFDADPNKDSYYVAYIIG